MIARKAFVLTALLLTAFSSIFVIECMQQAEQKVDIHVEGVVKINVMGTWDEACSLIPPKDERGPLLEVKITGISESKDSPNLAGTRLSSLQEWATNTRELPVSLFKGKEQGDTVVIYRNIQNKRIKIILTCTNNKRISFQEELEYCYEGYARSQRTCNVFRRIYENIPTETKQKIKQKLPYAGIAVCLLLLMNGMSTSTSAS